MLHRVYTNIDLRGIFWDTTSGPSQAAHEDPALADQKRGTPFVCRPCTAQETNLTPRSVSKRLICTTFIVGESPGYTWSCGQVW